MNQKEQMKLLNECRDSMQAIFSTTEIALEKLSNEGELNGYHTGGILRSSRFHSQEALFRLARYIEELEKAIG